MGRTAGWWLQDTSLPDGLVFQPATSALAIVGTVVANRDGLGLYNVTGIASQTVTLAFFLSKILRFGMQDDGQQAFGSASGTGQAGLATPPGIFATYLQQSGRPPYTAAQNQIVPTKRPKGIGVISVTPVYSVLTADATSVSIGVTKTVFANNGVPAVTALLTAGTNGQTITHGTTAANAIASALSAANAAPVTDVNAEVIAELSIVLPVSSTVKIYGLVWNVQFNYN